MWWLVPLTLTEPLPGLMWVRDDGPSLTGRYRPANSTPVLLWPQDKWAPSSSLRNDCPPGASERVACSRPGVEVRDVGDGVLEWTWAATEPMRSVHMSFVRPHRVIDSVIHIRDDRCQGSMCYKVNVPGRPFEVCMKCTNAHPPNAQFVYTPTWFQNSICSWECLPGFGGPSCDPWEHHSRPLLIKSSVVVFGLAGLILIVMLICWRPRPPPPPPEPEPPQPRTQMVQFRDDVITHHQIRVKIQ